MSYARSSGCGSSCFKRVTKSSTFWGTTTWLQRRRRSTTQRVFDGVLWLLATDDDTTGESGAVEPKPLGKNAELHMLVSLIL